MGAANCPEALLWLTALLRRTHRLGPPAWAAGLLVPLELVVQVVQVWVAVQAPRWRLRVQLALTTPAAAHAPQEVVAAALWAVPAWALAWVLA